jgi:hypothetical protein
MRTDATPSASSRKVSHGHDLGTHRVDKDLTLETPRELFARVLAEREAQRRERSGAERA